MTSSHPHAAIQLERARLIVVLTTIALNLVAVIIFAVLPGSDWRTAVLLNILDHAVLLTHILRRRDTLLLHFLVFGLTLGLVELTADAWLVDVTHTLDYSICGGPMLWRSPFWMPLAWEVVAVQFGYIGLRLVER